MANASGDRDGPLLERFSATSGFEWQAIANLLLESKPPGFAFVLLEGLRLRLTVYVTDDPSHGFGSGAGAGIEDRGPNSELLAPGFPPLAQYQFVGAGPGATILSIGPQIVYYARRLQNPAVIPPQTGSMFARPNDVDRVQYLNALVRERVETALLRDQSSATVVWTNPQAFRQDISLRRIRVEDLYRQVVSLLVLSKRLTEDESRTLTPNITITIEDRRNDKTDLLPAIEERGAAGQAVASPLKPQPESPPEPITRVWSTITPAVVKTRVEPSWPSPALNDTHGTIILDVWIDESGDVAYVKIVRSIPLNDPAAIDAVRRWKFTPAARRGRPIAVVQEVRLEKR
jgi:TonB family protein